MMNPEEMLSGYARLSDGRLLAELAAIRCRERRELARFVAALAELDRRHLAQKKAFPSVFSYCVRKLCLSEDEACRRARAARAARRCPAVLSFLQDGSLTLSSLSCLEPALTPGNAHELLERAKGKSARDVEKMAVELAPKKEVRDSVRIVSVPTAAPLEGASAAAGPRPPSASPEAPATSMPVVWDRVRPNSPGRDAYRFAAPSDLTSALARIKALLWHKAPKARLGDMLLEVCLFWLRHNDPQLRLAAEGPRAKKRNCAPGSRRIPGWVKDAVRARDQGRCAFVSEDGRRCEETAGLEFDHITPFALGGRSDDPANIREACRGHNQYLARLAFGDWTGQGRAPPAPG